MQIVDEATTLIQSLGLTGWDVILALAVVLVALPVSRWAGRWARRGVAKVPGVSAEITNDVGQIAQYAVLLVSWSLALSVMGLDAGWLVAVVLVIVVVVILMIRPLIENSAAGLLLQARPSFGVGDQLEVAGYRGEVVQISARTTALKTPEGTRVHIPNTQVLGTTIIVYTAFKKRRVCIDLGVDPNADLDAVSRTLIDAVAGVDTVVADPAPLVLARSFGDGAINLSIRFWFGPDTHNDTAVMDKAIRALQRAISDAGISLPPPQLFVQTSASTSGQGPTDGSAPEPSAVRSPGP